MRNLPQTITQTDADHILLNQDPIIDRAEVQWAARKFLLVYGPEAPEAALKEVLRLEQKGSLRVAEMFEQVSTECAHLLKRSEKIRSRVCH